MLCIGIVYCRQDGLQSPETRWYVRRVPLVEVVTTKRDVLSPERQDIAWLTAIFCSRMAPTRFAENDSTTLSTKYGKVVLIESLIM